MRVGPFSSLANCHGGIFRQSAHTRYGCLGNNLATRYTAGVTTSAVGTVGDFEQQKTATRTMPRELLAPVYGWFTDGFDALDLTEAKALLDELAD
jgi:hypothetical protein